MAFDETVKGLFDRVAGVLAQLTPPPHRLAVKSILPDASLEGMGVPVDSLGLARLSVALEDEFQLDAEGIELTREDVETLADLIAFVEIRMMGRRC